jgi:hypothetical protein
MSDFVQGRERSGRGFDIGWAHGSAGNVDIE